MMQQKKLEFKRRLINAENSGRNEEQKIESMHTHTLAKKPKVTLMI